MFVTWSVVLEIQVYTLMFRVWCDKRGEISDSFCGSIAQFGVGMWLMLMYSQEGVNWHLGGVSPKIVGLRLICNDWRACKSLDTRVGTLIVATIYLQLIQNQVEVTRA